MSFASIHIIRVSKVFCLNFYICINFKEGELINKRFVTFFLVEPKCINMILYKWIYVR